MVEPASTGQVSPSAPLDTHLGRVLVAAERERRTGALEVESGSSLARIHVVEGRIVGVEHGLVAETLGRILVAEGKLEQDEYLLILEAMEKTAPSEAFLRFGEVAIKLGMLSTDEVTEALQLQVRRKVVRCLQLEHAQWQWLDAPAARIHFPCKLPGLVLQALRTDPDPRRLSSALEPYGESVPRRRAELDALAADFELSAAQLRFVRELDRAPLGRSLEQSQPGLRHRDAVALTIALVLLDAFELPASPTRNERAHAAAARLRDEIARRGGRAAQEAGVQESAPHERLSAEQFFARGRRALEQGALKQAQPLLARAAHLMPATEYVLWHCFAAYLSQTDEVLRTAALDALRDAAQRALLEDRNVGFTHYVRGRIFLVEGDERGALKAMTIAAHLDPSLVDAQRYSRLLKQRLEE
ncbi:MAG: DUF4388 domain-containing protein [Sandaracinaceae bacterium]|nr:DUF4388 domain-containing protein [Sandaracinaceae bacterium]